MDPNQFMNRVVWYNWHWDEEMADYVSGGYSGSCNPQIILILKVVPIYPVYLVTEKSLQSEMFLEIRIFLPIMSMYKINEIDLMLIQSPKIKHKYKTWEIILQGRSHHWNLRGSLAPAPNSLFYIEQSMLCIALCFVSLAVAIPNRMVTLVACLV